MGSWGVSNAARSLAPLRQIPRHPLRNQREWNGVRNIGEPLLLFCSIPDLLVFQPAGIDRVGNAYVRTDMLCPFVLHWVTGHFLIVLLIQTHCTVRSCFSWWRSSISPPAWFPSTISHLPIFLIKVRRWTRSLMLTLSWGRWRPRIGLDVKEYDA